MAKALQFTPGDLDLLTRTLYGECRGEPLEGQQGVAWVIRTRAVDPGWWTRIVSPSNEDGRITSIGMACICPSQFSCWNTDDPNLPKLHGLSPLDPDYVKLSEVARAVLAGEVEDPTNGSTHYEVIGTGATWAKGRAPEKTIGRHNFYRVGKYG